MTSDSDQQKSPGVSPDHAHSAEHAWHQFVGHLETKQLRVTKARQIVFDEVFERHDHFTADELAKALAEGESRVSRSTVYNTLSLLTEAGLVSEIRDLRGGVRYEHTFGHPVHDHMICDECGVVFEFSDDELLKRLDEDCQQTGFVRRGHRITVWGVCREFAEGGPDACPHHRQQQRPTAP